MFRANILSVVPPKFGIILSRTLPVLEQARIPLPCNGRNPEERTWQLPFRPRLKGGFGAFLMRPCTSRPLSAFRTALTTPYHSLCRSICFFIDYNSAQLKSQLFF